MRSIVTTMLVLTMFSSCSRGTPEAAVARAPEQATMDTGSACPPSQPPGPGWRTVTTRDGRAVLSLPRAFTRVPADSAEIWGDSLSSIGYKARDARSRRGGQTVVGQGWCTERIGGLEARLRYEHARATFGEGQYVRVLLTTSAGTELALNGLARDSAAAKDLLTIARSLRVQAP